MNYDDWKLDSNDSAVDTEPEPLKYDPIETVKEAWEYIGCVFEFDSHKLSCDEFLGLVRALEKSLEAFNKEYQKIESKINKL